MGYGAHNTDLLNRVLVDLIEQREITQKILQFLMDTATPEQMSLAEKATKRRIEKESELLKLKEENLREIERMEEERKRELLLKYENAKTFKEKIIAWQALYEIPGELFVLIFLFFIVVILFILFPDFFPHTQSWY